MNNFEYEVIDLNNEKKFNQLKEFLLKFDLEIDMVDYSIVVRDNNKIIATASKFADLIKCVAVCEDYVGHNISTTLINKIIHEIAMQGYESAFLITKRSNRNKFIDSGLYEIYSNESISYFTNNISGYKNYRTYLKEIAEKNNNTKSAAIVMNANPFTIGHKHLLAKASKENELVYLIVVKEDTSFFTYEERKKLIIDSTKEFKNIIVVEGSDYLISNATFPSYFIKEPDEIIRTQAALDVELFLDIYIKNLNIVRRYVGEEPFSHTTDLYNEILKDVLSSHGVELIKINRLELDHVPVSASHVRESILEGDVTTIKKLTSENEWGFLTSSDIKERAIKNVKKIKKDY